MHEGKRMRALICYAGSAPEASIGSKPIGSELKCYIGRIGLESQDSRESQPFHLKNLCQSQGLMRIDSMSLCRRQRRASAQGDRS